MTSRITSRHILFTTTALTLAAILLSAPKASADTPAPVQTITQIEASREISINDVESGSLMMRTDKAVSPWASMAALPLTRLSVQRLNANDIVMDATSGQALAFGPTHMAQTAKPGEAGLSVIAAHKKTHFAYVKDLRIGDRLEVEGLDGQRHEFSITYTEIVYKDASGIAPSDRGPARLALVTCYPFDVLSYGGPLRYIVYADKI